MRRPPKEPPHDSLHAVDSSVSDRKRFCPRDCVELHTELVLDPRGSQYTSTRCELCGMTVRLSTWSNRMTVGERTWTRWCDDTA